MNAPPGGACTHTTVRGLIAEDEPLLAADLQSGLQRAWPALQIVATVQDGRSAVEQALRLQPEVLFFDIRMPGMSGIEAAAALARQWPAERPFPALVFVTAYDQYAVQAFEAGALDYLLKPVTAARLDQTTQRLRALLAQQQRPAIQATLAQLQQLLGAVAPTAPAAAPLAFLQVGVGSHIRFIALADVLYLEAADKYVRVVTAQQEFLIRTPLKDLLPRLDPALFWQIHRGTVVNAEVIDQVSRDAMGRHQLRLRGRDDRLAVGRAYAWRFKAM